MRKNVIRQIRRNPARSMRKMAKQMKTSKESMRRLARHDIGMEAYKIQKHQLLTTQTKQKRPLRSKAMLLRFTGGLHKQIIFSDEKLFTVEQSLNKQNYRILALSKDALPQDTFRVFRTQKPMSVMVWAGAESICEDQNTAQSSPTNVHKDLEEVYKDTVHPYSTVVDWARRFGEGRVSIEDGARIGRPVSRASDKNILEVSVLLEEDTHITLVEIADAVGIPMGTAQAIVHDNVKFRKICA
ncbi:hypothetical protein LOD99_8941 [Oopsacas minuta]|uniref:Uncharacterized protein n=1 Tax=Oopsacas minuta TaxID=111878 RepID=A0AAV7JF88_9METZ|nr:hypothetical protein LOD99_8941 [Oopsacas minuta]